MAASAAAAAAPANGDSVNNGGRPPAIGCPLLILYGSETGTAQEAAERAAREARARHWSPRVLPADAADLRALPREHAAVFLVATAGQGEFPANCRALWRFLARASLPAGCLSGLRVAVFGFGDSGYPLFNAAARKLFRRLVDGLGAAPLLPLGLGDDQAGSGGGPDAALDAWLRELWPALRATTAPLPAGVPEEAWGGEGEVGRLGPCRFSVELVAARGVGEALPPPSSSPAPPPPPGGGIVSPSSFLPSREEALRAHAAFHRLDALASGELAAPPGYEERRSGGGRGEGSGSGGGGGGGGGSSGSGSVSGSGSGSGPARPLLAVAAANRRLTPPSHWQETRHLGLRIIKEAAPSSSSKSEEERQHDFYCPGDVAAFLPEQSGESVRRVLAASGLGPRDRVRVSASSSYSSSPSSSAPSPPGSLLSFETTAAALVAGVLELDGAPPRRRLFEVLAAFVSSDDAEGGEEEEKDGGGGKVSTSLVRERLRLFASPEGRADLDLYCSGESRTLSEVLADFPAAAERTPLRWLLSAAPRLRPRRFSIASAPPPSEEEGGGEGAEAEREADLDLTVAVVRYHTPHGRPRLGLASGWLSTLGREEEEEEGSSSSSSCLPFWVERGALSLPALAAAAARQVKSLNRDQQQQQPSPLPPLMTPLEAWLSTPLILIGPGTGIAPMRSLLQARRRAAARMKSSGGNNATAANANANANANAAVSVSVAPCLLYFGCRSPAADWYYRSEFEAMVEDGTLLRYRTAFSREEIEEEEEEEGKDDGQKKKKKKEKKLKPKRYVTHLLREDADELWRLLSPPSGSHQFPAAVVVAGSAKNMPRDVQQCFEQDVAAERGGLGAEGGKAFVRRMVSSGRYFVEAWS